MSREILLMKGSSLMESIQRYSPEQQEFLGINVEEFKTDQQALTGLEQQISTSRSSSMDLLETAPDRSDAQCCSFPFWKRSGQKTEPLLINEFRNSESFIP